MSHSHSVFNPQMQSDRLRLQIMFDQITLQLRQLLEKVTQKFKLSGIKYNALQYQSAILRIITPFDLIYTLNSFSTNQFPSTIKPNPSSFHQNSQEKGFYDISCHQTGSPMKFESPSAEIQKQSLVKTTKPLQSRRHKKGQKGQKGQGESKNNFQNKVDTKMEQIVYHWSQRQFEAGRKLQIIDICKYALSVSTNPNFLGSSGWCANFLKRHPDIKHLVKTKNNSLPEKPNEHNKMRIRLQKEGQLQCRGVVPQNEGKLNQVQSFNYKIPEGIKYKAPNLCEEESYSSFGSQFSEDRNSQGDKRKQ